MPVYNYFKRKQAQQHLPVTQQYYGAGLVRKKVYLQTVQK